MGFAGTDLADQVLHIAGPPHMLSLPRRIFLALMVEVAVLVVFDEAMPSVGFSESSSAEIVGPKR